MLFTIDIRNAFNTTVWSLIIDKRMQRRIPNYLICIINRYLKDKRISTGLAWSYEGENVRTTPRISSAEDASEGAYRTVSKKAIQVVTGTPPIQLLVSERKTLYREGKCHLDANKKVARKRTIF
ncbi:hypothetical protein JTB14_037838 [Gonioctena quinquepunctata]|nr:hypothetical protein JTB14_037838 [Gonioctena quinquepunctata]